LKEIVIGDKELDNISEISLSDHELQLKEIVISSDFNNNHYDEEEFDSEDYNEDYDRSNDDHYDYNEHNEHNKSSFKMLSFVCNVKGCLKKYTLKSSLKRHIQHHHIEKNPQQVDENKRSHIRENLELENILENNEIKIYERKYPCKVPGCNRLFDSKSAVATHKRYHNTEKDKKCDIPGCDDLWDHDPFHLENNRKVCDEPEYSANDNLQVNCDVLQDCQQQIHVDKELFKCEKPGCDKVYKRLCHLRTHQNRRKHHTSSTDYSKDYICDEPGCDKVYKHLYYLKKHKDHSHINILLPYVYIDNINFDIKKENTYNCNNSGCSYTTNQLEDLTNHEMIHSDEKHFSCNNITVTSENKIHNLRHQFSHKNDQVFVKIYPRLNCNYQGCNKKFITLTNLKKHKAKAHSKSTNGLFKNYNKYKKIQIPTSLSHDFVNKKQLDTSDDKSKGNDLNTYRLRKRPRTNKINMLDDDDDNDCLCKFTGCRKIFNSTYSLKIHQQKFHMITKTYPCDKSDCNFRTKFFEKLKKHQLEKHGY
jgi:uncharacterized Zn-finger protein